MYMKLVLPHQWVGSNITWLRSVPWIRFAWHFVGVAYLQSCNYLSVWQGCLLNDLHHCLKIYILVISQLADVVLIFRLGSYSRLCPGGVTFPTVFTSSIKTFSGGLKRRRESSSHQEARKGNILVQEAGSLQW